MKKPVLLHSLGELEMGGALSMAADIATLLTEYSHVLPSHAPLDRADQNLNMWLFGRGLDVAYSPHNTDACCPETTAVLSYRTGSVVVKRPYREDVSVFPTGMRNVPIASRFSQCARQLRTFRKFHVGLLFGKSSFDGEFVASTVRRWKDSARIRFLVTSFDARLPDSLLDREDMDLPMRCRFEPGIIERHLAQCNVLAMLEDGVSDRLAHEARAAGVPVIIGKDADTVMRRILELEENRVEYDEERRMAFRTSLENDMSHEIVKLKSQLRKIQQWNTTISRCGRDPLRT